MDGRYEWLEEGILDPSGAGPMVAEQPAGVPESDDADSIPADPEATGNGSGASQPITAKVQ